MKKYSIYDLFVVEVLNGDDVHYFICKYNIIKKAYIEIFTNKKIEVLDKSNVEPLVNYFSLLARRNYTTGKPLMLNKQELLKEYAYINNEANLAKDEAISQSEDKAINVNGILEKATLNFFPKDGGWHSTCFHQPKDLEMRNLPCHLRDDLWLAKMLKQNQKLFYMSTNRILQFVKTSPFFQEKRHEYEQEIVKWQIDWMISDGENWLADDNYGGDFVFLSPLCDLGFRKGIVDTLTKIGMSIDAIEEGIEKNADMWRDSLMNRAFNNEYEPVFLNIDFVIWYGNREQSKQDKKTLEPANPEFKEKWLKMRKYEYYQRHKDSVDKYGIVEPDMMLSNEEVSELKAYLKEKHNERMLQISQFNKDKNESLGHSRVLKNN